MATRVDSDFLELQKALAGEYSLERELGRGGMGIVYLAREVQLNRLVAIKVLPSALAERPELRERFVREARMAASLSHPNIVPIHRVGEAGPFAFFVMAYVDGETLGERLRLRGPLSPVAATRMLREVAWALAYAHGRGVVHRDVKPDNILVEAATGRALVTDFGIAVGGDDGDSGDGRVMGTAQFMSPEQATGAAIDGRSDLYALGIVGYLAVSGRLPFDADSLPALLSKQVREPAPPLNLQCPGLPRALANSIDRCLRKDPVERFPTGEAMADALEETPVARTQLPAPLRLWLRASDPLRPLYLMWSSIFFVGTLTELRRGDWPTTLSFMLLPLIPSITFHARKLRRVLGAGYTLPDVQHAVKLWQAEKREELAFEHEGELPRGLKILRVATLGFAGLFALLVTGVIDPYGLVTWIPTTISYRLLAKVAVVAPALLAGVSAVASHALGVPYLPRDLRRRLTGGLRSWFWNSRAGAVVTRLLTPKRRQRLVSADYRPTEMALGVAVDELFDALPKSYRVHLAELPEVVRRLEAHAAACRVRVGELEVLDASGSAVLSEELTHARKALGETVAALEAIRLDLLRLHGGETDLRPITSVLEASQQLGVELGRLTSAQREVDKIAPARVVATPA
ncbi:MAG TPA: serine/threonine-protein kinase [Gemmatimonadaceae bacterium]|nr:serine/threonine-protein kinase [Gemmatimonadaceae bacterium]